MNYSLNDRFATLEMDRLQSVGGMSLIPLCSSVVYDNIKGSDGFEFEGTNNYGTMVFKKTSEDLTIIPSNVMVITDAAAQDHAMGSAGFLDEKNVQSFDNACCIQSSQGGYIRGTDQKEFNILPLTLRDSLGSTKRFAKGYDRLWKNIEVFNKNVAVKQGAHLEYFFKEHKDELDEFIAEFEVVKGQIGALIYFGEKLVGIEITPNVNFWAGTWQWLIRGCYGSEYLRQMKLGKQIPAIKLPKIDMITNLSEVFDVVSTYINSGTKKLASAITGDWEASNKVYQHNTSNKQLVYLKSNIADGDAMFVDGKPVYVSLYKGA